MLVAQSLDPTAFPQFSRLPTNLASTERFPFGGFDALANGVICTFTWMRSPPNFSFTCRISNWRTVACSNSATKGSKSSHSCQRIRISHRHEGSPSTGRSSGRCPGYVVDHVRPLECGGADAPSNRQWQTVADGKAKDKTEGSADSIFFCLIQLRFVKS